MATVGYVTTTNETICLGCVDNHYSAHVGRVDFPDSSNQPIEDPAPKGIYNHAARNGDRYDSACALCGWAIRRSR
jgi:hypothetical protein